MTDLAAEIQALREDLADIRASLPRRRHGKPETKQCVNMRLETHELAAIDAAAAQKGQSRSEFMRGALAAVVGFVITPRQEIPAGLRHARNRKKPSHFHDPKVPLERDSTSERAQARLHDAAKRYVAAGIEHSMAKQDAYAATAAERASPGMLSETAAVRISVPKPSR